jgi:hypothetical protein
MKEKLSIFSSTAEVRSFIYQQLAEFEPFLTSATTISVLAKNPLDLQIDLESEGKLYEPEKLKKMNRIAIVMNEEGGQIGAEALHENIYDAVVLAKERVLKRLREIHDSVVSNQDRIVQIDQAKNQSHLLH